MFRPWFRLLLDSSNFDRKICKGNKFAQCSGGVRHGPQRVMDKNITDVHFTRDTMEETSYERPYNGGKNGNKTLFPVSKRITKDMNVDCFSG